jgi:hypothetical protein
VRGLVAIAVFAGCYNPSIRTGAPCDTECPGDLVCIDHRCREAGYMFGTDAGPDDAPVVPTDTITVDGPPGDADGDGIKDNLDNCPAKANLDQHDEDADALGDVCDPCPHLAGTAVDGDGDGVGDACDPQVAIAKQRIKFFDPFTTTLPEWNLGTGASRVGETLRVNGAMQADAQLSIANSESRVVMGGTIAARGSGSTHQISISFGEAQNNIYHYCEFYDTSGTLGDVSITKANLGTYNGITTVTYPSPMPTGAWGMRIDESVSTQRVTLEAKLGGVTYAPPIANTSTAPALVAASKIKIYIQNADVRFDYFLVIETLP